MYYCVGLKILLTYWLLIMSELFVYRKKKCNARYSRVSSELFLISRMLPVLINFIWTQTSVIFVYLSKSSIPNFSREDKIYITILSTPCKVHSNQPCPPFESWNSCSTCPKSIGKCDQTHWMSRRPTPHVSEYTFKKSDSRPATCLPPSHDHQKRSVCSASSKCLRLHISASTRCGKVETCRKHFLLHCTLDKQQCTPHIFNSLWTTFEYIKASSIRGIHSRHVQPLDLTVPTKPPYAQAVSASVVFACMPHVACCVCWLDTPPLRFGLSSVYTRFLTRHGRWYIIISSFLLVLLCFTFRCQQQCSSLPYAFDGNGCAGAFGIGGRQSRVACTFLYVVVDRDLHSLFNLFFLFIFNFSYFPKK